MLAGEAKTEQAMQQGARPQVLLVSRAMGCVCRQ